KMVITGDKTQIDLPKNQESGLIIAERTLKYVQDIHFQILEQGDVVRHPLVAKVIAAYSDQEL
ncbi:MAG: PhoH family protein, partial [Lysinibacillus sp.]